MTKQCLTLTDRHTDPPRIQVSDCIPIADMLACAAEAAVNLLDRDPLFIRNKAGVLCAICCKQFKRHSWLGRHLERVHGISREEILRRAVHYSE